MSQKCEYCRLNCIDCWDGNHSKCWDKEACHCETETQEGSP